MRWPHFYILPEEFVIKKKTYRLDTIGRCLTCLRIKCITVILFIAIVLLQLKESHNLVNESGAIGSGAREVGSHNTKV